MLFFFFLLSFSLTFFSFFLILLQTHPPPSLLSLSPALDQTGLPSSSRRRRSTNYNSDDSDDDDSSNEASPQLMPRAGASAVPPPPAAGARGTDLKTGYLEKRIGEHSTRSSLPDAFRWQRRYFVLTESKGMLYYFKSPDDPPNYKGVLSLRDCRIDDLDVDGSVRGGTSGVGGVGGAGGSRSSVSAASGGKYDLDGGAGAAGNGGNVSASSSTSSLPGGASNGGGGSSLLFRISHRDPTRAVYKNHASLVLRAESASEKFSWLARLRAAAANAANAAPVDTNASSAASPRNAAGPLASGAAKRAGVNGSGDGSNVGRRRSSTDASGLPSSSSPPPPPALVHSQHQPRPATIPASGIGSALAHGVSSKLGPEPPYVYGPSSTSSSSRDAFLEALGADTASYVRTVCATISVTVPKAAVHCQVKRAQGHLLEALYAAVSSLPPDAASGLLAEDGDAGARRAAAAAQSVALADAYGRAATARENAVTSGTDVVALPASVVEIAGGLRRGGGGGGASSNGRAPPPRVSVVSSGNDNGSAAPTPTSTTSPSPMPRRRPPPAPPSDVKTG